MNALNLIFTNNFTFKKIRQCFSTLLAGIVRLCEKWVAWMGSKLYLNSRP